MKVFARTSDTRRKLLQFERKYSDKFYICGPEYYNMCDFRCVYCITESQGKATAMFKPEEIPEILDYELGLLESPLEHTMFVLNGASDPYVPLEEELQITRILLEEFAKRDLWYSFCTKGDLVLRDTEILASCGEKAKPIISLSSTNEEALKRLEPQAPSPQRRINALNKLYEAGVNICLSISPWVPGVSDIDKLLASIPDDMFVYVQPLDLGYAFEETFDNRRPTFSAYSVFNKQFSTSELNQLYVEECNRVGRRDKMEWRYPITKEFQTNESLYLKQLIPGKYSPDDFKE